jgi:hypothetical protein
LQSQKPFSNLVPSQNPKALLAHTSKRNGNSCIA